MKNYTRNLNCVLCTLALMLGLFMLSNKSDAQSQGVNSPVWVLNVNWMCQTCPGATWGNLVNGEQVDSVYAVATLQPYGTCTNASCFYSREYTPSEYLFHLPLTATITGIELQVSKKASSDNAIVDRLVQLMNADTLVGASREDVTTFWTMNNEISHYGGSTDLWGYNWTPAMINSNYFGAWFKAENKSNTQHRVYVDWIGITVYYSTTSTTGTETISSASSSNNINVNYDAANNSLSLVTNFEEAIPSSTVAIFNMLGQVQFKKEMTNIVRGVNRNEMKTNTLAPGVYLVEFTGGGRDITKKMVVAK